MKKTITLGLMGLLLASLTSYKAMAQETKVWSNDDSAKESQEIVIRQKGDKDTKLTLEITGDKVLVNGKPLAEFNENGVTINNKKVIIRDGDKIMFDFDGKMEDLGEKLKELGDEKNFRFNFEDNDMAGMAAKSYTYLGVSTNKSEQGAEITDVTKDSPAEKSGLQKGDIIYKIDNTKIDNQQTLSETIRAKKDGDKVKVYYLRNGNKNDVKAVLGTQKNTMIKSFSYSMPDGNMGSITIPRMPRIPRVPRGEDMFGDEDRFGKQHQKLGIKIQDTEDGNGVKIIDVAASSPAATAGLMTDDVITEIGDVKISNTDEAREELSNNADRSAYVIKAKRNGSEMTFNIRVPKNLKTTNL